MGKIFKTIMNFINTLCSKIILAMFLGFPIAFALTFWMIFSENKQDKEIGELAIFGCLMWFLLAGLSNIHTLLH